ncbi:MAG TPA: hypothetical protein VF288_06080 [Mycobacteriales bacterium]
MRGGSARSDDCGQAPVTACNSRRAVAEDEASTYLGFLAAIAGLDNPTANDKTRRLLGWEPTHPGWVEDVRTGHYMS